MGAGAELAALTVAMIDLDHFKSYNDQQGHLAGDALLKNAAATWRELLRSSDVLARWGGEEFVLLLPDCDKDEAAALVGRMRGTLPDQMALSAGIAQLDATASAQDLIAAADRALYQAKANGRDRIEIADSRLLALEYVAQPDVRGAESAGTFLNGRTAPLRTNWRRNPS